GQINLAMQRGELDGHGNSTWTSIKTALPREWQDGKLNVLIQLGLRKEADLPDVPLLSDLVQNYARKASIARFMSLAVSIALPFPPAAKSIAQQTSLSIGASDLGGVVTSPKGPEAGAWVIAETTDLPTKYAKIVVTDDAGRYVLPDLPKAKYKLWVRGYGLID